MPLTSQGRGRFSRRPHLLAQGRPLTAHGGVFTGRLVRRAFLHTPPSAATCQAPNDTVFRLYLKHVFFFFLTESLAACLGWENLGEFFLLPTGC